MIDQLLDDLTLAPGEGCAITGSGGKTTLLWFLAGLARQHGRVIVSVTAKMFPPRQTLYDKMLLDPACYDPLSHPDGSVQLIAAGQNGRGKLLGISDEAAAHLKIPGTYLIMEADGSRGLPLKMWQEHEPPVPPSADLTLGVVPITALGQPVSADNVYHFKGFSRLTGLCQGDPMTIEAFCQIILDPKGLFKNSPGRKVLVINQADSDALFEQALRLVEALSQDPRSGILTAAACMSLEELQHENLSHYTCRRLVPAHEPQQAQP